MKLLVADQILKGTIRTILIVLAFLLAVHLACQYLQFWE